MKKLLLLSVLFYAFPLASYAYPADVHGLPSYGLNLSQEAFYDAFEGNLLTAPRKAFIGQSTANKRKLIRKDLNTQYESKQEMISSYFPSMPEDEQFIAFLMLKIDGAKPIYSTNNPKLSFKSLVYSPYAECQTFALTTATILKVYGKQASVMGFETPHIFGHVVTLHYDSSAHKAYLIDSNSNFMAVYRGATGPFDQMLREHTVEEVQNHLSLFQFPFYERYFKFDTRYTSDWTEEQKQDMLTARNTFYAQRLKDGWNQLAIDKDALLESFNTDTVGVPTGVFSAKQAAHHLGWDTYANILN